MMRPLAPYTLRPIHTQTVRRTITPEAIRKAAEQEPTSIKPERVSLKVAKPIRGTGLKIIGRADNDTQ